MQEKNWLEEVSPLARAAAGAGFLAVGIVLLLTGPDRHAGALTAGSVRDLGRWLTLLGAGLGLAGLAGSFLYRGLGTLAVVGGSLAVLASGGRWYGVLPGDAAVTLALSLPVLALATAAVVIGVGQEGRMRAVTIVVGGLLIAVLAPLSQFLTMASVNADVETATPVGWAVGILFAAVLALAAVRIVARTGKFDRPNLVILYSMLTIAVPLVNLGLVRQVSLATYATLREYLEQGNSVYRTSYENQGPWWFPSVPTNEGLVWNKTERLVSQLIDDKVVKAGVRAGDAVANTIAEAVDRAKRGTRRRPATAPATQPAAPAAWPVAPALAGGFGHLGLDQIRDLRDSGYGSSADPVRQKVMADLGLTAELLQRRHEELRAASQAARLRLTPVLRLVEEFHLARTEAALAKMDDSGRHRSATVLASLPEAAQALVAGRARALDMPLKDLLAPVSGAPAIDEALLQAVRTSYGDLTALAGRKLREVLGTDLAALGGNDMGELRGLLMRQYQEELSGLSADQAHARRMAFAFRMTRNERSQLMSLDGTGGQPNDNAAAFYSSVWAGQKQEQERQRRSAAQNFQNLLERTPWHLWLRPLAMWSLLFLCVFGFLMCLAEWLRRKWIERENLAFPLVDAADYLMRHDASLETAEDIRRPQRRFLGVSPAFLAGMALGALVLSAEAVSHYQIKSMPQSTLHLDVSKMLADGALRELTGVIIVLSPIVIGLAFMVSLEISFSVWFTFVLYSIVVFMLKTGQVIDVKDSVYTGFGAGRQFPFVMDQFLGAAAAFTLFLLLKAWRSQGRVRGGSGPGLEAGGPTPYLPPWATRAGLVVLPVAALGLLWGMGVRDPVLLGMFAVLTMTQTVAQARLRAETGLPAQHVSYDFTRLPMILGLTSMSGARNFTSYISACFMPVSLLFRTLPQQLENLELARRHKVNYRTIAWASLIAFVIAVTVGFTSFLLITHAVGGKAFGEGGNAGQGPESFNIARHPLWVSHFQAETGLDKFNRVQWHRVGFMAAGFAVVACLIALRTRFLRFPLHPIGYLLILFSIYYTWVSPYYKGVEGMNTLDASWIWSSFFVAWLVKWLIVKYGGMNAYRAAKPLFLGLVVGSVVAVVAWNGIDLVCSLIGESAEQPAQFVKYFLEKPPFSPRLY